MPRHTDLKTDKLSDSTQALNTLPRGRNLDADLVEARRALKADTVWREPDQTGGKLDHIPATEKEINAAGNLYRAMHGGIWGIGCKKDFALNTLRELSSSELQHVIAIYRDLDFPNKRDLIKDLSSELGGLAKQELLALLKGDRVSADAIGIRRSLENLNNGAGQVQHILANCAPKDLPALNEKYKLLFKKEIKQDLKAVVYGDKLKDCLALLHAQPIETAKIERLRSSVIDFPHMRQESQRANKLVTLLANKHPATDQVLALLEGISAQDAATLRTDFAKATAGLSLDTVLEKRLSGRSLHLARQYMRGAPEDLDQALALVKEDNAFEAKGAAGFLLKRISHNGRIQTKTAARAESAIAQARKDGTISEDEALRIKELVGEAKVASKISSDSKDQLAEKIRHAASVTLGTGITVATGGAGIAVPIAMAGGAVLGPGVKRVAVGPAYERSQIARDSTFSAIESTISAGVGVGVHAAAEAASKFPEALSDTSSGALKLTADRIVTGAAK